MAPDPLIQGMLVSALPHPGFAVTIMAHDVEHARELLTAVKPDVVIIDADVQNLSMGYHKEPINGLALELLAEVKALNESELAAGGHPIHHLLTSQYDNLIESEKAKGSLCIRKLFDSTTMSHFKELMATLSQEVNKQTS